MSGLSRRDLLRASAGAAAVAVPMSVLSRPAFAAGPAGSATVAGRGAADATDAIALEADGPVMFCVHDAAAGQVSILHGSDEVVVSDRALVNRILRAAAAHKV
ncbi:MAG: twin-arginine translocation signal domain-containing protein [Acidimicrobiia bacterium]|nr:twin-arginine translocation signal domain-containing protein [Acidimicrobiia bacterium]